MKNQKHQSILIIEDDELYALKLKKMLEKYAEEITISSSAENGSYFVSKLKPSIIFLDNQLPKVSGNDALELFKDLSPDSVIILMSATWDINEVAISIQRKADYMFDKLDFENKELELLMHALPQSEIENRSIWRILDIFSLKTPASKIPTSKIITIVEDDELFYLNFSYFLHKQPLDATILSYSTGESFIKDLSILKPHLVFLDYHLPDMTGSNILDQIKKESPESKVIIISSQDDYKTALDIKSKGVDGYIKKDSNWKENVLEYLADL